jgi:hypothetical protein
VQKGVLELTETQTENLESNLGAVVKDHTQTFSLARLMATFTKMQMESGIVNM